MNFVKASLKYKQVTITTLLILFVAGVYSLINMPRREDPKINVRQGQIIAIYPGANSLQVEKQVTEKLEQYLFQFEEVRRERTFSTTRDGIVIINVWLNGNVKDSDVFWSKLRHQLLTIKMTELPQGVIGPLVNSEFGDTEAIVIGVESGSSNFTQLKDYVQKIENGLRTIPSVSKVKRLGEQKEEIQVNIDNRKLAQYGINLYDVMKILQSQNTITAGGDIRSDNSGISLYAKGYYQNENEIADQIIGSSGTGEVIKLADIAEIKRQFKEPETRIYVNGKNSILIALQMHEGQNIVEFGKIVDKKLDEISQTLPSDVKLTTIINQPYIVDENISHFLKEFVIAIVAVILIIILLLPFRVAAVAAMAIPMTVSITIALMKAFGIELHQVSLAALIVVLGMVVDDAVVVADNYVELLDKGVERTKAAWKSATELVVPILTATITIIAAFMPMIILSGTVGEFIEALPVTVSIALASSFLVAMVFTPILCFVFIKKGIGGSEKEEKKRKKFSVLDKMQQVYDIALIWSMKYPKLTIAGGVFTVLLAAGLYNFIPQKFFPAAERNQLVIELWMPTGTKLEATEKSILKIQDFLKDDSRVTSYTTFIGMSAPRFYYNFSPEAPVSHFAQILVNTKTVEDAGKLFSELSVKSKRAVPEGKTQVKLMQQGPPTTYPVEIRISGDDLKKIKSLGNQVASILRSKKLTELINTDFKEDYYGIDIKLKTDAERLGFTTESVGKSLYASLSGITVSLMYEGNNAVDVVLRSSDEKKRDFDDLQNTYLTSPVTGASVPVRQIAELTPEWYSGRIVHRNGIRTLTIQAEPKDGIVASQVLAAIKDEIDIIKLPAGYNISYGGESENQIETFSEMIIALGISLLLIFIILLFQFKNLKETVIVISSIPLSMFGGFLGLLITNNNFGFTAFMGIISLSGVVVRNAIILVDYTNELINKGLDIKTASLEAGKRRLRPIFLTASAAAVGVVPMIISGSPLWSPLASVIAFGIVLSMVVSLLVVPVLYQMLIKPSDKEKKNYEIKGNVPGKGTIIVLLLGVILIPGSVKAQVQKEKLNLNRITELAIENNRLLRIKMLQVKEKENKVNEDIVNYFPDVSVDASYKYVNNLPKLSIEQGSFGQLPLQGMLIPLPSDDKVFELGTHDMTSAGITVYQPVSQLLKIRAGTRVSQMDELVARSEYDKTRLLIKQAAEKLYYGLLITQKQINEAELNVETQKAKFSEIESALASGKTTESNMLGMKASLADEEQKLLKLNIEYDNYLSDLNQLTGLEVDNTIELEDPGDIIFNTDSFSIGDYHNMAMSENIDLKIASFLEKKSLYGKEASLFSYLPDIGIAAGYQYQKGNSLYPKDNMFVGALFQWNIQNLVSNKFVTEQREYVNEQAMENLYNSKTQVSNDVKKALRKLKQSEQLVTVARKVVNFRRDENRIISDKYNSGLCIKSDFLTSQSSLAKAEADLFAALVSYRLTMTDLLILTGNY